jgi:hypothetical protein
VLRAVADTLGGVVETDESDNGAAISFETQPSPTGVAGGLPIAFRLSTAFPNPSPAATRFALDLPRAAVVEFRVLDVQGREIWQDRTRGFAAGRWTLDWPGQLRSGARAPAGLYLAQVVVDGRAYSRRIAVIR